MYGWWMRHSAPQKTAAARFMQLCGAHLGGTPGPWPHHATAQLLLLLLVQVGITDDVMFMSLPVGPTPLTLFPCPPDHQPRA
jgi:hypothetical protein